VETIIIAPPLMGRWSFDLITTIRRCINNLNISAKPGKLMFVPVGLRVTTTSGIASRRNVAGII
jgi:hypothetical protein